VTSGLLPLKLNTGADRRELERAVLLKKSLNKWWNGQRPFELHIVCRDDEIVEAEGEFKKIGRSSNVLEYFHAESEYFSPSSPFFQVPGMYKQQLIKLFAPNKLALGPFITFDSDVVCLREFDETTLVYKGRLASKWEPRGIHSWWENSMSGIKIWSDMQAPGFGVTPNLLHSEVCGMLDRYFAARGKDTLTELATLTQHHPHFKRYEHEEGVALVWSEYSLYNLVAEWFDVVEKYHLPNSEVEKTGIRIHSNRCVWSAADLGRLKPDDNDPGHFLIVQSWAGVSPEYVVEKLKLEL
jgi:Family of unknown function (DUF6492)